MNSALRKGGTTLAATITRRWPTGSRLFLVGEGVNWSIDHDLRELAGVARRLGVRIAPRSLLAPSRGQAAFYGSQFTLLREPWSVPRHRLATAYFHGRPSTPGHPEFDECYRMLRAHHDELARVQVTHSEMHDIVLESGIDRAKVRRIPIGVDAALFAPRGPEARESARRSLGLPESAFVVGSFQKDGVGFGDGHEPKWIKGPDVLLAVLGGLRRDVPELHVLLSGPARGYVRAGLERLDIPYRHRLVRRYEELPDLYAALDAYAVASRQEGGPKGVLEAMAAGVPVVTTRVGQAMDLVRHGENGWLVDVADAEALTFWLRHVAEHPSQLDAVTRSGLATARENSYEQQLPLWRDFFTGLVELAGGVSSP